jgi:hypothetical protein
VRNAKHVRIALVGALCAAVGAGAGIAGSTASSGKKTRAAQTGAPMRPPHGGPPVHAVAVVPNQANNGFVTVTEDSGTVESVSGDQLAIKEGTKTLTYKSTTLTIPSDAKVYRNFATAKLGDLQAGDRVHVASSSEGTVVMARDASHQRPEGRERRHGGPPGPGAPGGPPWPRP